MATIAKLVAEMAVDPAGVKPGLDRAAAQIQQFSKTASANLRSVANITPFEGFESNARAGAVAITSATDTVVEGAEKGIHGLGRLEHALSHLAAHALGFLPIFGNIGAVLGGFVLGTGGTIAIVAGIVAIALAWEKLTEHTRESTKAMNDFRASNDAAFRAANTAQAAVIGQLSGLAGNRTRFIDRVGLTKDITEATHAVEGFRDALERTLAKGPTRDSREAAKALSALRIQYAEGAIDVKTFGVELGKIGTAHPKAAVQIAATATLAAQYDAAREAVQKLTAAEEHRFALEEQSRRRGPSGDLSVDLENARRRAEAFARGGEVALNIVDDSIEATKLATEQWDKYVTTLDGAKFASLTFADALRTHNAVAESVLRTSTSIVKTNRDVAESFGVKPLEEFTTRILKWHEAATKAGSAGAQFGSRIAEAITRAGQLWAEETDKMSDRAVRLKTVLDQLTAAFAHVEQLGRSGPFAGVSAPTARGGTLLQGGTSSTIGLNNPVVPSAPFAGPALRSPRIAPPELTFGVRFRHAMDVLSEGAEHAAEGLGHVVASGGLAILSSIASQLNPFKLIIDALTDAMKPLEPVLAQIAIVIKQALTPIFVALAPVVAAFIPFFRALLQIVAPLVQALTPILLAFVPILEALFPIIKLVAIAFTYVVEAASLVAAILLRMAGNVVIAFGYIVKALAEAIDKLPFVSAKGAINAAQGVIDFGHALLGTSDEFKKTAEGMAKARDEIRRTNIDHAVDGITQLGDAAAATAAMLTNVPTWYKIASARYRSAAPGVGGRGPFGGFTPPTTSHDYPTLFGGSGGGGGGSGGGGGEGGGGGGLGGGDTKGLNIQGDVHIDAKGLTASEIFDAVIAEGKKRARAQGVATWSDVRG